MFYKSRQLATALKQLTEENPKQEKKILNNFLDFCRQKNILYLLTGVIKQLKFYKKTEDEKKNLNINSFKKLNQDIVGDIKKHVGFDSAQKSEIVLNQDESLKGGFIAKYKGKIYDASVVRQLNTIKNKLEQNL